MAKDLELLNAKEIDLLEQLICQTISKRIKKHVIKGLELTCFEDVILHHIKLYLEGVRITLMRTGGENKKVLSKSEINSVFLEVLNR